MTLTFADDLQIILARYFDSAGFFQGRLPDEFSVKEARELNRIRPQMKEKHPWSLWHEIYGEVL